ncbi:MAG: hypothetical protein H6917_12695 [Novosphingobium sp.]|nr:hypothetical protein [Novosphingobium sp.]
MPENVSALAHDHIFAIGLRPCTANQIEGQLKACSDETFPRIVKSASFHKLRRAHRSGYMDKGVVKLLNIEI